MTCVSLRALATVVFLQIFAEPTPGGPPASADSLRIRPPQPSQGLPGLNNLKGLGQRLNRKRLTEKDHAVVASMLERLTVRRSRLDNMPLAHPGAGLAYNMPIARPNPFIDYKMLVPGTSSVRDINAPDQPRARRFKRK